MAPSWTGISTALICIANNGCGKRRRVEYKQRFQLERLSADVLAEIMGVWLGQNYKHVADAQMWAMASNTSWFVYRRISYELAWGWNDESNLGSNVFPSGPFQDDTWCEECRRSLPQAIFALEVAAL